MDTLELSSFLEPLIVEWKIDSPEDYKCENQNPATGLHYHIDECNSWKLELGYKSQAQIIKSRCMVNATTAKITYINKLLEYLPLMVQKGVSLK